MLIVIAAAVAIVAFIVYALERKSRNQPIVWLDALKLALFGGVVGGGVSFATTAGDGAVEVVKAAVATVAEDMFVGTPTF
jgi:uncharacterized membrane protein YeiH